MTDRKSMSEQCVCGDGGPVCRYGFVTGIALANVCIHYLDDGMMCGHSKACHAPTDQQGVESQDSANDE